MYELLTRLGIKSWLYYLLLVALAYQHFSSLLQERRYPQI